MSIENSPGASLDKDGHIIKTFYPFFMAISPERTGMLENIRHYLRRWDNQVDQSPYILPVKESLLREINLAREGRTTDMAIAYLESIDSLPEFSKNQVKQLVYLVLCGMYIDLTLRINQKPIPERKIRRRNILDLWPVVEITGVILGNKHATAPVVAGNLIHAWGMYDIIADLTEDLKAGLNLIPCEDNYKYCFNFQNDHVLPNQELSRYYFYKRREVSSALGRYSKDIFRTGLPLWLAALGYVYYETRRLKLRHPLKIEQGVVYKTPLDI